MMQLVRGGVDGGASDALVIVKFPCVTTLLLPPLVVASRGSWFGASCWLLIFLCAGAAKHYFGILTLTVFHNKHTLEKWESIADFFATSVVVDDGRDALIKVP